METVKQITDELAIAGQPTLEELSQLGEAGYRSVVNLRSPNEVGFLDNEQRKIEYLGLRYINISTPQKLTLDDLLSVIQRLNELPKPILVHCDSGIRASIAVLMQLAINRGVSAEKAFQRVAELGLLND